MTCDETSNTHARGRFTNVGRKYPKKKTLSGKFTLRQREKNTTYMIENWVASMWSLDRLMWLTVFVTVYKTYSLHKRQLTLLLTVFVKCYDVRTVYKIYSLHKRH
jgi:hypothetical protein